MSKSLVTINDIYSFRVDGYIVKMKNKIRQYYEFENCFIARIAENNTDPGNKSVMAISYIDKEFQIIWEFPHSSIISISPIKLGPFYEDGVMFNKHLLKYEGKELLKIYSNDRNFLVDVNTGEIYSSSIGR